MCPLTKTLYICGSNFCRLNLPPRVDSVVWVLISAVAVTFIKEDSDDKAEDVECDDEEEAADRMGVISTDDEAGGVRQ